MGSVTAIAGTVAVLMFLGGVACVGIMTWQDLSAPLGQALPTGGGFLPPPFSAERHNVSIATSAYVALSGGTCQVLLHAA
jgi:hypothetical protein